MEYVACNMEYVIWNMNAKNPPVAGFLRSDFKCYMLHLSTIDPISPFCYIIV